MQLKREMQKKERGKISWLEHSKRSRSSGTRRCFSGSRTLQYMKYIS